MSRATDQARALIEATRATPQAQASSFLTAAQRDSLHGGKPSYRGPFAAADATAVIRSLGLPEPTSPDALDATAAFLLRVDALWADRREDRVSVPLAQVEALAEFLHLYRTASSPDRSQQLGDLLRAVGNLLRSVGR